jgi:hypothetical protein
VPELPALGSGNSSETPGRWRATIGIIASAAIIVAVSGLGSAVPARAATTSSTTTTATPVLSVNPTSGPVGSVVTVTFGPADNGCGDPTFQPVDGTGGGQQQLPYIYGGTGANGDSGAERFVIPRALTSPSARPNAPVDPGSYQFAVVCDVSNNPSMVRDATAPFTVTTSYPAQFVGIATAADGDGYWLAQAGGGVFSYGDAQFYGSLPGLGIVPDAQIVGIVATADGKGYWLDAADGGVFSFGDARFYGSMGTQSLNQPIVGMTRTPDGNGYWEVESDGSVFSFGDAHSFGSGGRPLDLPTVGLTSTPDGNGYWEVESDGGVFSYGDAVFRGSMGGRPLGQSVVAACADPITGGYWEIGADGGVFAFDAPFLGSTGSIHLNQPIAGMAATPTGDGYRLVAADGGIFDFGDAQFYGSAA